MELRCYLANKKRDVEEALEALLPRKEKAPADLHESMRYSVLSGGKRLRPILCIAAVETLGRDPAPFMKAACSLELVHTYSLIHDDLPSMDDDDLRRGKPTNHKIFGEALAILAGDALLTLSFELISSMDSAPEAVRMELVRRLARAGGGQGLVGGQALDLASEGKEATPETVRLIHERKTAALIETSVIFGAILGGASAPVMDDLKTFGHSLGMAFQITDDLLDAVGEEDKAGKRVGKDDKARKATFTALCGVDASRRMADDHVKKAVEALRRFGDSAWALRGIARSLVGRES